MFEGVQVARRRLAEGGALVTGVSPASPAGRAGIRVDDVIVRVDRYPTPTWSRYDGVVSSFPEGADLDVTVRRGGADRTLPVRLGRLRDREAEIQFLARTSPTELGVRVDDAPTGGVALVEVPAESPAAAAGLKAEDVLIRLDGRRVESRLEYFLILRRTRPGESVPVEAVRGGETVRGTVTLKSRSAEEGAGAEEGEE